MRQLPTLTFLAALAALGACQQQPTAKTSAAATATPAATVAATAPVVEKAAATPAFSAEEVKFLKQYDLAPLLAKEPDDHEVMNGFYGADHYRIEFAMLDVRQDPANPAHYFVTGKNRFKKVVTPFEGEIIFSKLANQPPLTQGKGDDFGGSEEYVQSMNKLNAYSALGTFTLREAAGYKGAGVFTGDVIIDFSVSKDNELALLNRNARYNTRGAQVLFEGTWKNAETQQQKSVVWVNNIFSFEQDILKEFMVGERDPDFNPKYAKLGWDTYWENEEWWAEPGTMSAQAAPVDSL